jgi:hypothetical protein
MRVISLTLKVDKMTKFKSSYDKLREKLHVENRIKVLSADESIKIVSAINQEIKSKAAEIRAKEVESEQELAGIVLNA